MPGPGDLLVEVHAASASPVDAKIRNGLTRLDQPLRFPLMLGSGLAGVVAGSGGTAFESGDRIDARLDRGRIGAFAEYALASEPNPARMPANLDFPAGASRPLAGLALWQALGADEGVDWRSRRFENVVRNVDRVFSTAGGDTIERSIGVLKRGGVLADIAGMATAVGASAGDSTRWHASGSPG